MTALWGKGYTKTELRVAQENYGLTFPPDLVDLLLDRRLLVGHDWKDDAAIKKMLHWPFEMLAFDIEDNGFWWRDWEQRPMSREARMEVLKHELAKAPKLIPLYSHRFIPAFPSERGNPVFSMYGGDTVCYGANLDDYIKREFEPLQYPGLPQDTKRIPFWSDLANGEKAIWHKLGE